MSTQEKKALTKDRLIGMQVYDAEANLAGTVQDIAFTVGKMGMTLIVDNKKGSPLEINWEDVQAAGDIVLMKPKVAQSVSSASPAMQSTQSPVAAQSTQGQAPTCPTCGGPLTFIPQYQRWYCYKDKKYV